MMQQTFDLAINYTQVTVNLAHIPDPGLLWSDDHVAQGFAWDTGTVAFGVPDHDGLCRLSLDTDRQTPYQPTDATLWAIAVPFDATNGEIEVGTILDARAFPIAPGPYELVFEALPPGPAAQGDIAYILNLFFRREPKADFAILKQGPLLSPHVLTRTAQRA